MSKKSAAKKTPDSKPLPYGGMDVIATLQTRFRDESIVDASTHGQAAVIVTAEALPTIAKFLRDSSQCLFGMLLDICGADYPAREPRFEVVYHLLSLEHNMRFRLKVMSDGMLPLPSVSGIWPSSGWYERECWDMVGVLFKDHPDLRRILTDYGFQGHPLRKDFPLTGYTELRYDDAQRRIVSEPVALAQEYRDFDFASPWEAVDRPAVLPGDEKSAPAEKS